MCMYIYISVLHKIGTIICSLVSHFHLTFYNELAVPLLVPAPLHTCPKKRKRSTEHIMGLHEMISEIKLTFDLGWS